MICEALGSTPFIGSGSEICILTKTDFAFQGGILTSSFLGFHSVPEGVENFNFAYPKQQTKDRFAAAPEPPSGLYCGGKDAPAEVGRSRPKLELSLTWQFTKSLDRFQGAPSTLSGVRREGTWHCRRYMMVDYRGNSGTQGSRGRVGTCTAGGAW